MDQATMNRVIEEEKELSDKVKKLKDFMETDTFRSLYERERFRLITQHWYMTGYLHILQERIQMNFIIYKDPQEN